MIIDEVTVTIQAGSGGDGCLSFRREKYIPRGGPDGGNGGRGGSIFLEARDDVHTLVDFVYRPLFEAKHGEHGKGKNKHGRESSEVVVRVPVGTLVWDEKHELIVDMNQKGMKFLIARGGRGGRGNTTFATSTQRAPKLAERGEPGEKRVLRLELKLLADVGIVGFPNAGKSTLLSRTTHARPKIADYPFTTLEPQLGVVQLSGNRNFVLADIPGIIEGASQGKGLGIRFLRHLERTKILLHLVEAVSIESFQELEKRIKAIHKELKQHSPKFSKMPELIVLTKVDSATDKPLSDWVGRLRKKKIKVFAISAVTGQGLPELMEAVWKMLLAVKDAPQDPEEEKKGTLYQVKTRFAIRKEGNAFYVTGPEITKWVAMTNFDNPDAVERFYKILQRMGVIRELKKKGISEGNSVFCDEEELAFQLGLREGGSHG